MDADRSYLRTTAIMAIIPLSMLVAVSLHDSDAQARRKANHIVCIKQPNSIYSPLLPSVPRAP